mmetsp:Transcript_11005/g.29567  ORF Transcript_11005/g.29567 Transcript_11005/m.29567 type:complete len:385 (+) Transcript_11005:212-1366(+)
MERPAFAKQLDAARGPAFLFAGPAAARGAGRAADASGSVIRCDLRLRSRARVKGVLNARQAPAFACIDSAALNGADHGSSSDRSDQISRRAVLSSLIGVAATAVLATAPTPARADAPGNWGYCPDNGPEKWAELSDSFALCANEANQTPINLLTDASTQVALDGEQLPILQFNPDAKFKGKRGAIDKPYAFAPVRTERAQPPAARLFLANGATYSLAQFHFHVNESEHAIQGKKGVSEIHFVFALDKCVPDDVVLPPNQPKNAVVGVLFDNGTPNPFVEGVLGSISDGKDGGSQGQLVKLNMRDILPTANFQSNPFFQYVGSLTTPPCTENIQWFVFLAGRTMSPKQVRNMLDSQAGTANWRPVQFGRDPEDVMFVKPIKRRAT